MEISGLGNSRTMKKINESKGWFFEQISKIDKPIARLSNNKRGKTQITNFKNEREGSSLQILQTVKGQKASIINNFIEYTLQLT